MTDNLKKAKDILISEDLTLVLYNGKKLIKSEERGIKPLLDLYEKGNIYEDFCAADKVVGKAAAFIYVLLGIKKVYAPVLSSGALEVFKRYNVDVTYEQCCPFIINRAGDGICPMEKAVLYCVSPEKAYKEIFKKLEKGNLHSQNK